MADLPHEFWTLMRTNKKYWLVPVLTMLVLFAVLLWLSSRPSESFVYTLF